MMQLMTVASVRYAVTASDVLECCREAIQSTINKLMMKYILQMNKKNILQVSYSEVTG